MGTKFQIVAPSWEASRSGKRPSHLATLRASILARPITPVPPRLPGRTLGRMPLAPDQLDDFIRSYESAFNELITPDQANELFDRLLDLYARIRRVSDHTTQLPTIEADNDDLSTATKAA